MDDSIADFGSVAPVADTFDVGGAQFTVYWMIADTDLEVLASGGKPFTEEMVNDVEVNRTRLAYALYQVEHKVLTESGEERVARARKWPDPLYRALNASYWTAYSQFAIQKYQLDSDAEKSVPGPDETGEGDGIPGTIGSGL